MFIKLITQEDGVATVFTTDICNFEDPEYANLVVSKEDVQAQLNLATGIKITGSQLETVMATIKEFGQEIKTGITLNGLDTRQLTEDQMEKAEMLDIHPALYDLYFIEGGLNYRCHMSSREKIRMIQDYENEQNILEQLQKNSYKEIDFTNSEEGYIRSQQFMSALKINH